ncbi:hypothetical protein TWF106_010832 [Orbilia oligospora]|uniref:Uncharacterized protein n=1 Tax=Orbilia oligospora TaxID=2813651 RepID=A0A6G1LXD7_ORBOL|nr:hypothetical protein TWF788_006594 [Orbilia oligospora]KAF3210053.1 hypothetical protein TWF106_010832 [Orbilia oligospora]KAF3215186.1 hypothetical protein TWF679_004428 [Orbilia oligospora]KAF3218880.1 hypothetical protein TWF191_008085 [Orbilia oligospora]KAF3236669.1 hypothetical protein TWF192_011362 [Orbilia oligospora]
MTQNSSSAPAQVPHNERPKVDVTEDLEYSQRRYISSPNSTDHWTPFGAGASRLRNNSDVLARVDDLGLSKKAPGKI